MSQTSVIFAVLFFAFVIFITERNELPKYLSIFGLGPDANKSAGGGGNGSGQDTFGTVASSLNLFGNTPGQQQNLLGLF